MVEAQQQVIEPTLSFISDHSHLAYPLIFVLTFLEGEAIVLAAGLLASQGALDAGLIFVVAWLGSFGGDQMMYWVGRCFGPRVLSWLRGWRTRVESLLPLINRRVVVLTLSFRFIYGLRNIAAFSIGLSGVQPARFAGLNFLGAGVWALSFVAAGYLFGEAMSHFSHHTALAGLAALIAVAVASAVLIQRRRALRAAA
jgi:membrane protein DedA with SNARE-associated domain